MSDYVAPLKDMQFVLQEIAQLGELTALPGFEEVNSSSPRPSSTAGKFANGVLSPLNIVGDCRRWIYDTLGLFNDYRVRYYTPKASVG
jgi:hypothetical protein